MREGTAVVGSQRTAHFKSSLMVGAAGLAVAGVSTAAVAAGAAAATSAPSDGAKWLPYASVGASVGDATTGAQGNLFVPVWQDLDSLLFVRLGVGTQTRDNMVTNFGLGYRTKIDSDWIVGLYGGFDATRTKYDHTFTQGTVGAELMSADWDVRINGYLATADKLKSIAHDYSLYIHDTAIAILQAEEGSYSGFDGEVGYRVFATDNADVRVFAGGFSFSRNDARSTSSGRSFDFSYRDITGPMGRAEVDIYDIDALGTQSRITVSGQISHDDVRGTSGYVGASLRIPLGAGWGEGGQALDDLDRRMVDEVRRQDNVLTTWGYTKPEPVIIYNGTITSEPTNTLYYVADDSPGTGSYTDPTSLAGATGGGATNPFIVVTDFGGPVTGGVTVHSGQTVVGGGNTFHVAGAVSGALFSHDFAPGSGTPTLTPATPGGNILTIDGGNASIYGMTFTGDFGAAIYGHNVGNVDIANVTIDGSGGGLYGVQVNQDMSQDMNLHITDSTITGLGVYGVSVNTAVSDGGTSTQTIELTNSTVSAGVADVSLSSTVSGGSTVNQSIVVDPTYLSGGDYGLFIEGLALGSGTHLYQNIAISDVTIDNTKYAGIGIVGVGAYGGSVVQKIDLTNVSVTGSEAPLVFLGVGLYGGSVDQQIDLTNVTANGATYDSNVAVRAFAYYGGAVHQSGTWTNVTASNGYSSGVEFGADAYGGGTIVQDFAISGLTAVGNYGHGLDVHGTAVDYYGFYGPTSVAQYFTVASATLDGNYNNGLNATAEARGYYATAVQALALSNSTASGNYYAGIGMTGTASYGGSVTQQLDLTNVTANHSFYGENIYVRGSAEYGGTVHQSGTWTNVTANYGYDDGAEFGAYAYNGGTVIQNFAISGFTAVGNHDVGFDAFGSAYDKYGYSGPTVVAQYFTLDNATISGTYGPGIAAGIGAFGYYAAALQELTVTNSTITYNDTGISAVAYALFGGSAQQIVTLSHDVVDSNYYDGGDFRALALAGGFASQTVNIDNSSFSYNGGDGVYLAADAKYGGNVEQNANIYFSTLDHNAGAGLHIETYASGFLTGAYYTYYSQVTQNVIAAYDSISHNGGDGAYIHNYASYGGQLNQLLYFYGDQLSANGGDGIHEYSQADAYGSKYGPGYAIATNIYSDLYVVSSAATYNGRDGINVNATMYGPGYLIQHVDVYGTDASYNTRTGFVDYANAYGVYSLNIQYVTLAGSYFDGNGLDGAAFLASQYYGPYSFGAAIQDVTIVGSDFSGNYRDGLYGRADASGFQGRAEQHFTIAYSRFDYNGGNGISLQNDAHGGAYVAGYDCGTVQGLYGGCAFVRQTVDIFSSDISYNGANGISIRNLASGYGAIYSSAGRPGDPTLLIFNSTVNGNGLDGLSLYNDLSNNSYLFQYAVIVDSTFDNNYYNGILGVSYVAGASTMLQRALLYSYAGTVEASHNGYSGVYLATTAIGAGTYAYSGIVAQAGNFSYDSGAGGIGQFVETDSSGAQAIGKISAYDNTLSHNDFSGVFSWTSGLYAGEYNYIAYNTISDNLYGLWGSAGTSSYQYWDMHLGNTYSGNGTDHLFNASGGATIVTNP